MEFRSKMSCLLHVSLYGSISLQFSLLVILHCAMDVFHFLYAKVIHLYFCNNCMCFSLCWTSKINSSISNWRAITWAWLTVKNLNREDRKDYFKLTIVKPFPNHCIYLSPKAKIPTAGHEFKDVAGRNDGNICKKKI